MALQQEAFDKCVLEAIKEIKNPYSYEDIKIVAQQIWEKSRKLIEQEMMASRPWTPNQRAIVKDMYKLSQAYLNIYVEYKELKKQVDQEAQSLQNLQRANNGEV